MEGYKFYYGGVGKRNIPPLVREHKYRFTNSKNLKYSVIVEEYQHNFFAIKFYVKSHELSKLKYNILTGQNDARRIIYTCIKIAEHIHSINPLASFGFVGSPTPVELTTTKINNTKRFKVYSYFAKFFFSPDTYVHSYDKEKSIYIMMNKAANKIDNRLLEKIITTFETHYDIEGLLSND